MTRKLSSRVRRLSIQSTTIRKENMMMPAQLVRYPKRLPVNQLSNWRRVDYQKSMELLVLCRLYMTLLRVRRTAVREEGSCPVLAKGMLSVSRLKATMIHHQLFWINQGLWTNH